MQKPKKIPERMCVGCREMKPKAQLLRVVRIAATGQIMADRTGKVNGRGAYICPDANCLQRAEKSRAFQRVFKEQLPEGTFDTLLYEVERKQLTAKMKEKHPPAK